jgi:predicted TIM-barrel fold metal-dependent hydrolase
MSFDFGPPLDVVDSQVHLFNRRGPGGRTLDIGAALSAMGALGITSLIADEFWAPDAGGNTLPGHAVAGGGFRPIAPGAEMAALMHPGQFATLLRVNHDDPDLDSVLGQFAARPGAVAIRIDVRTPALVAALAAGEYRRCFAAAQRLGLRVCVLSYGQAPLLDPYLKGFPDVTVIVDHCGLVGTEPPEALRTVPPGVSAPPPACTFEDLLALAGSHRNPAAARQLARAVEAVGRERVAWGSDTTAVQPGFYTWAEALFYVRDTATLSPEDKEWVLGRSARSLFGWPAAGPA